MRMSSSPASTSVGTERAEPVGRVVGADDLELGEVGVDGHRHRRHLGLEGGGVLGRSSKNGTVNAHSRTSRMMNGTPL